MIDATKLTLKQQIGQLFMVGFDAMTPNDHILELIKTYQIGNVILFGRNVESPRQLIQLTRDLQELAMREIGIPLFISIDQEGGMVTRIKDGSTFFPGAMTLAASDQVEHAYITGKHMGEELHYLGVNMNLAPSLDVNNNPRNPVIGVRSYGDDPDTVSRFGNAFINGLQEHVIATAKHFPGHGDTHVDSHLDLPTIDIDKQRFETVELRPFRDAITQGVQAIMSSHINFPLINEDGRPTTLSYNALTTLLRQELGFEGLIITDCMQMKAIEHKYTTPIGSKMAIEAGADLICVSHDKYYQVAAYQAVLDAVTNGEIASDIINDRVNRILSFKAKLKLNKEPFEQIAHHVINPDHKEYALRVVNDAVTLVKGRHIDRSKRTLLIACNPVATTIADENNGVLDIVQAVKDAKLGISTRRIGIRVDASTLNDVREEAKNYEQVIFCSYNANILPSQITLMDALTMDNENTFVFSMRNPYDTFFSSTIQNVMNFYEYTPNSVASLLDYLKGTLTPRGKAPVHYE